MMYHSEDPQRPAAQQASSTAPFRYVLPVLGGLLLFRLALYFLPITLFWGADQLQYFTAATAVIITAIPLFLLFYSDRETISKHQLKELREKKITKTANAKGSKEKRSATATAKENGLSKAFLISTIVGMAILFWCFKVQGALLGDGSLYIGYLYKFHGNGHLHILSAEPLGMVLIEVIFYLRKIITEGRGIGEDIPFQISGLLFGTLYLVISYLIARLYTVSKAFQYMLFALLLGCGGLLFYFGYVETYAAQFTLAFLYLYVGLKYLKTNGTDKQPKLATLLAVLVIASAFHLQNLLILPSFIYLMSISKRATEEAKDQLISNIYQYIPFVFAGLFVIYLIIQFTSDIFSKNLELPFINLFSKGDFHYTLFHPRHLIDLLNEHLLVAAVPILLIGVLILTYGKQLDWKAQGVVFLLLSFLLMEALLISGNTVFGLARDWDIFAILGPLSVLLFAELATTTQWDAAITSKRAISIAMTALLINGSWIALNAREASSVRRYDNIVTSYAPLIEKGNTFFGYENERKFYMYADAYEELHTIRKMIKVLPWPTPLNRAVALASQHANIFDQRAKEEFSAMLQDIKITMSDSLLNLEEVGEPGKERIRIAPEHSGLAHSNGDMFANGVVTAVNSLKSLTVDQAITEAEDFIRRHPNTPYGYEVKGYLLHALKGTPSMAISYYSKAIVLDKFRPQPRLFMALALGDIHQYEVSKRELNAAVHIDSSYLNALDAFSSILTMSPQAGDSLYVPFVRHRLEILAEAQPDVLAPDAIKNTNENVARAAKALRRLQGWHPSDQVSLHPKIDTTASIKQHTVPHT